MRFLIFFLIFSFGMQALGQQQWVKLWYEPGYALAIRNQAGFSNQNFHGRISHSFGMELKYIPDSTHKRSLSVGVQYSQTKGIIYQWSLTRFDVVEPYPYTGNYLSIPMTYTSRVGKYYWGMGHGIHYFIKGNIDYGDPFGKRKFYTFYPFRNAHDINLRFGRSIHVSPKYAFSVEFISRILGTLPTIRHRFEFGYIHLQGAFSFSFWRKLKY